MDPRRYRIADPLMALGGVPSLSAALTTPKILLAEDVSEMRRLLATVLRDTGYDVVELQDGNALWDEVRRAQLDQDNPRVPDLVISDVRMPGLDGLEVLARLRARDWTTPFIIITAFGDAETVQEARRLGAARVFSKPFEIEDLVAAAVALVNPDP